MKAEYLLTPENEFRVNHLVPVNGRELFVVQKRDEEFGDYFVVVPGFKVGGPHPPNSKWISNLQALDIEPVEFANRETIEKLLKELGFKGPINFW